MTIRRGRLSHGHTMAASRALFDGREDIMERPLHSIASVSREMTPERAVGIGFVVLLHILLVAALVSGLANRFVKAVPQVMEATIIQAQQAPHREVAPPKPKMIVPVAVPQIQTKQEAPSLQQSVQADTAVKGITSTHTSPPYPPGAKEKGQQGMVQLRLSIDTDGLVTDAQVVVSSGVPELDDTAARWVKAHWRYHAPEVNGTAVASTTMAQVIFDLKNAH
jgi:protein TonB